MTKREIIWFSIILGCAAIVLHAVLSWVNPHSPAAPLLDSLTRPLLRPLRRLVPPIANVDLSPLLALIGCQLLLTVPLAWAEAALTRLL